MFEFTERSKGLQKRLRAFMEEHVYPNEVVYKRQHAALGRAGRGCGTCSCRRATTAPG